MCVLIAVNASPPRADYFETEEVQHVTWKSNIYSYSYSLQANEQNNKIIIKQTHPQHSMPHGRLRVMTPLTRNQK